MSLKLKVLLSMIAISLPSLVVCAVAMVKMSMDPQFFTLFMLGMTAFICAFCLSWSYIQSNLNREIDALELKLRESSGSKKYADDILQSLTDCVIVLDKNLDVKLCNHAAEAMMDYHDGLIGKSFLEIVENKTRGSTPSVERLVELIKQANVDEQQAYFLNSNQIPIPVSLSTRKIVSDKGGVPSFVCIAQDIRGRLKQERELIESRDRAIEVSQMKTDFVARMSHELRTPLNGIIGMTDLTLYTELNDKQQHYLEAIMESSHNLLNIVNDILDFSKIEAGKFELLEREFRIADLIKKIKRLIDVQAKRRSQEFTVAVDPRVPEVLVGDDIRLQQILINLLGNAVKFTDEQGGILLRIDVVEERGGVCTVRFGVSDSGVGIPEEKIQLIFDAFTQVDGSSTRRYGGTGLGLSIAKSLVEMMGGILTLESSTKIGTVFQFSIAMKTELDEVSHTNPIELLNCDTGVNVNGSENLQLEQRALHILVADDNQINQECITRLMKRQGHSVAVANNGLEVLDQVEKDTFDILLLDIQMPEMCGIEATQRIRQSGKDYANVPIIAVTAFAMKGDKERIISEGFNEYISKPICFDNLLDKVKLLTTADTKMENQAKSPLPEQRAEYTQ